MSIASGYYWSFGGSVQSVVLWVHLRPSLEAVALAGLCGWGACLAIGLSLFSPTRALLVGFFGIGLGWASWRWLGLPPGPALSPFPPRPSLVGSLFTAFASELLSEAGEVAAEVRALNSRMEQRNRFGASGLRARAVSPPPTAPVSGVAAPGDR